MYLSGNGTEFGFKHPKINKINEEDVLISDEVYHNFFAEQAKGKSFKVINRLGKTFEEIFTEVT